MVVRVGPENAHREGTPPWGLYPQVSARDGRVKERKGIRVGGVSVKGTGVKGDEKALDEPARKTWGSLKTIIGRGSRWVSSGHWDKQNKDDKVFI